MDALTHVRECSNCTINFCLLPTILVPQITHNGEKPDLVTSQMEALWRKKKCAEIDLKHFKAFYSVTVQNHCEDRSNAVSEELEQKSCPCE